MKKEVLKDRYVSGYDSLEQFERYVEQTLREGLGRETE